MLIGKIYSIPNKAGRPASYAFIKGDDGHDYFLHSSELFDTWDQLKWALTNKKEATISFESAPSEKGLRAVGAKMVNPKLPGDESLGNE